MDVTRGETRAVVGFSGRFEDVFTCEIRDLASDFEALRRDAIELLSTNREVSRLRPVLSPKSPKMVRNISESIPKVEEKVREGGLEEKWLELYDTGWELKGKEGGR